MWSGARGADSVMFRSIDRGESFEAIDHGFGPHRGMLMRLRRGFDGSGDFFGVANDGTVTRGGGDCAVPSPIAEKLPPAYDLVIVP